MVVYNLNDLKNNLPDDKKIGLWSIGRHIHDAHRFLYQKAKNKCDHIIGIYWHNWPLQIEQICNVKNHQYYATKRENQVNKNVVREMEKKCDIVMIFTGDYTSFENNISLIQSDIKNQLPLENYKDDIGLVSLRTSQATAYMINKKIKYHYRNGGTKDPWRKPYVEWHRKYYPNIEYELVDSILDEKGNSFDCCSAKNLNISRPLLKKGMRSIEEVKEHIKDIKGLKIVYFQWDGETINARFQYGDNPNNWWHAGLKE